MDSNILFQELMSQCNAASGQQSSSLTLEALSALYVSEPYSYWTRTEGHEATKFAYAALENEKLNLNDTNDVKAVLQSFLGSNGLESSPHSIEEFIQMLDLNNKRYLERVDFISAILRNNTLPENVIPGNISCKVVEPTHTSSLLFLETLEKWVLDHPFLRHQLFENFTKGLFPNYMISLLNYLLAYQACTDHFSKFSNILSEKLAKTEKQVSSPELCEALTGIYDDEDMNGMGLDSSKVAGAFTREIYAQNIASFKDAILASTGTQPWEGLDYSKVAQNLISSFRLHCGEESSVISSISALYCCSELIAPIVNSRIVQSLDLHSKLPKESYTSFLLLSRSPSKNNQAWRKLLLKYADTKSNRLLILQTVSATMSARFQFLDDIISFYNAEAEKRDEKAALSSASLYNQQSNNWVRKQATCLSDFTGRPLVFEVCQPHIDHALVLDVGCGEGYCSRKFVEMGASFVLGVDVSPQMIQNAIAQANPAREAYLVGDATQLQKIVQKHSSAAHIPPGSIDMQIGSFHLATAVFVFNYVSAQQMRKICEDVFSLLAPGGYFVFSVPHPFMLFSHRQNASKPDEETTFYFNCGAEDDENHGQYFSLVDRLFSGVIKTVDGRNLNVRMKFKTFDSYFATLQNLGFEIVEIREANVKSDHYKLHPAFFDSVKDMPLHLVFKVRKPAASIVKNSMTVADKLPKKIRWSAFEQRLVCKNQLILQLPEKIQRSLASVANKVYDTGVNIDTFEWSSELLSAADVKEEELVAFGKEIRHRVLRRVGLCVIQSLDFSLYKQDTDDYEDMVGRLKLAYYILCSFVGFVDGNARGRLFDVRDSHHNVNEDNVLFSVSNTEAGWHTDGASRDRTYDGTSLLCISRATQGGELKVANIVNAWETLKLKLPKFLLFELLRPLPRDLLENGSGQGTAGDAMLALSRSKLFLPMRIKGNAYPIIVEQGDRLKCRYMRFWIETAHEKVGWKISPLLCIAMDCLDDALNSFQCYQQVMSPGEMVFVNNCQFAHARTAFLDGEGDIPRYKVRAWLQLQKVDECD